MHKRSAKMEDRGATITQAMSAIAWHFQIADRLDPTKHKLISTLVAAAEIQKSSETETSSRPGPSAVAAGIQSSEGDLCGKTNVPDIFDAVRELQ